MSRKQLYWLIKTHLYYTTRELCELLQIDESTIRRWIKKGMPIIRKSPRLMKGSDVKEFLKQQALNRKRVLKDNQFYCVKCDKAVTPGTDSVRVEFTGKKLGRFDACNIVTNCPICGISTRRFSSSRVVELWLKQGWVLEENVNR